MATKDKACGASSRDDRFVLCNRGVGHRGAHINYGVNGVIWSWWKRGPKRPSRKKAR